MKYAYKDCEKRLKEIFKDVKDNVSFAYVLEGVLENAKVDDDFVQNAMDEKKSFKGMMNFAMGKAKELASKGANYGVLDDNQMIEVVIEYFNKEEKEEVVKKSNIPNKVNITSSTKTTKKSAPKKATNTVKNGMKVNKYGRTVKPLILDDEDDDEEILFK